MNKQIIRDFSYGHMYTCIIRILTVCILLVLPINSKAGIQNKCIDNSKTGSDLSVLRYCRAATENTAFQNSDVYFTYAEILKKSINRMPPNQELAKKFYIMAELHNPDNSGAFFNHGILLLRQHRYEEALNIFQHAAQLNHPDGTYQLAMMISKGSETQKKSKEVFDLLLKAAMQGEPRAQVALRDYYSSGTPELNLKESYFWALAASTNGDYLAKSNIESNARRLSQQEQINQQNRLKEWLDSFGNNEEECVRLYRIKSMNAAFGFCIRAARSSSSPFIHEIIGDLYMSETAGNSPDTAQASRWYEISASEGNTAAAYKIGTIYDQQVRGLSASESQKRAFEYFSMSAKNDHQNATLKLGIAYELGRGTLKSRKEAINWFKKSALLGNEEAAYRLGCALNTAGEYEESVFWLSVADIWGYRTASAALKSVQRKLSSSKLNEIKDNVDKFISRDLSD